MIFEWSLFDHQILSIVYMARKLFFLCCWVAGLCHPFIFVPGGDNFLGQRECRHSFRSEDLANGTFKIYH